MNRDDMQGFQNRDFWENLVDNPNAVAAPYASASMPLPQQSHANRRTSDFSFCSQPQGDSTGSHWLGYSHARMSFPEEVFLQQQAQLAMDSSESDPTVRFLEQRIRDEATRASIAEQSYHRAMEESRRLQQAYFSLLPAQAPHHDLNFTQSIGRQPDTMISYPLDLGVSEDFALASTMPHAIADPYSLHNSMPPAIQYPMVTQFNVAPTSSSFLPPSEQRLEDMTTFQTFPTSASARTDNHLALSTFASASLYHHSVQPGVNPTSALSVVKYLGSTVRQGQLYMDVTKLKNLEKSCCDGTHCSNKLQTNMPKTFPEKLHALLTLAETDEKVREIISFCPHGRAFQVLNIPRFCAEVAPKFYSGLKQWKSFTRQLNLYGFTRIVYGPDSAGYFHPLFLRNHSYLCRFMMRVGVTQPGIDRRYKKSERHKPPSPQMAPDFYRMGPFV